MPSVNEVISIEQGWAKIVDGQKLYYCLGKNRGSVNVLSV